MGLLHEVAGQQGRAAGVAGFCPVVVPGQTLFDIRGLITCWFKSNRFSCMEGKWLNCRYEAFPSTYITKAI